MATKAIRWLSRGAAIVLCVLVAACGSREEAAFRTFSETYSCPRTDMAVTPVEGVTMRKLWLRANPLPEPPAEVRADPARLAVWHEAQEKNRAGPLRGVEQFALFHVEGCGRAVDYACFCPPHTGSSVTGRGTRQDFCGCQPPPAPIAAERQSDGR